MTDRPDNEEPDVIKAGDLRPTSFPSISDRIGDDGEEDDEEA